MTLKTTATKAIALALIASFATTTALPVSSAEAGHKKHWKKHHKVHKHHKKHRKHRKHRDHGGDALAAGIIGFALGAIIADQANRPRRVYVEPQPIYVEPQPIYREPYVERRPLEDAYDRGYGRDYNQGPKVIRYEDEVSATYEPWTPEWARWCDNRYRSFNPNTGTFRGYDGRDHFCVVK